MSKKQTKKATQGEAVYVTTLSKDKKTIKIEKKKSPKNIHEALLSFQSEKLVLPRKGQGKSNNGKEYRYVTLDDMIQHAGPILQKYGIGFTQLVQTDIMETKLFHAASGTELSSTINLGKPNNMQDYGGRITYAKRYALGAILGLSSDEDLDAAPIPEEKLLPLSPQTVSEKLIEQATKPAEIAKAILNNESAKIQHSESFDRAKLAIGTAYSAEALELIKRRIEKSTNLSKEEHVELQQMIIARETEVEGTVR